MITVVTGPPCSGKSTYVRQHAKPGDIVIDFDVLAQALGSPAPHDHDAATRHVTIMARRAAIAAAITVHQQTAVWIVETRINPGHLEAYQRAGATIHTMAVPLDVLHQRADRERPGLWHRLIDEWVPAQGITSGSREW